MTSSRHKGRVSYGDADQIAEALLRFARSNAAGTADHEQLQAPLRPLGDQDLRPFARASLDSLDASHNGCGCARENDRSDSAAETEHQGRAHSVLLESSFQGDEDLTDEDFEDDAIDEDLDQYDDQADLFERDDWHGYDDDGVHDYRSHATVMAFGDSRGRAYSEFDADSSVEYYSSDLRAISRGQVRAFPVEHDSDSRIGGKRGLPVTWSRIACKTSKRKSWNDREKAFVLQALELARCWSVAASHRVNKMWKQKGRTPLERVRKRKRAFNKDKVLKKWFGRKPAWRTVRSVWRRTRKIRDKMMGISQTGLVEFVRVPVQFGKCSYYCDKILGGAPPGGFVLPDVRNRVYICPAFYSCGDAVVGLARERGCLLAAANTLAHEFGHEIGMVHQRIDGRVATLPHQCRKLARTREWKARKNPENYALFFQDAGEAVSACKSLVPRANTPPPARA